MALLGSTVDPRLFVQDYSGFTRAADTQAQSMANIGANVGSVIKGLGEDYKDKKQLEAGIKATVTGIESAIKMGKSLGIDVESSLTPYLEKINDPNVSPVEAAAYAQQASNSISNVLNFGMKANEIGIEKERYKQATAARIAELQAESKNLQLTNIDAGNRKNVPVLIDKAGNMFSAQNRSPIVDINAYASGSGGVLRDTTGMEPLPPLDFPQGEGMPANDGMVLPPLNKNAPASLQGFDSDQATSISADVNQGGAAANVQAGLDMNAPIPLGQPMTVDKAKSKFRVATSGEALAYGVPAGQIDEETGRFYPTNAPTGMTFEQTPEGGFKLIQGPGVGGASAKAEAAKEAQKEQSFERSRAIIGSASKIIPEIQSVLSSNPLIARGQQTLGQVLPAGEAGRIASDLETIRVQTSKEEVGKMRASSPTGSAGGTITEKEWPKFENRFGKMEVGMNPNDLVSNVQKTALNQFESVNGTPEEVVKLFNDGKISKPVFDDYLKEYKQTRSILGIADTGTGGPGDDWTKYNPSLLRFDKEKQSQLSPEAQSLQDKLDALKANK
jgi:hypothetical protein